MPCNHQFSQTSSRMNPLHLAKETVLGRAVRRDHTRSHVCADPLWPTCFSLISSTPLPIHASSMAETGASMAETGAWRQVSLVWSLALAKSYCVFWKRSICIFDPPFTQWFDRWLSSLFIANCLNPPKLRVSLSGLGGKVKICGGR